MRSPLTRLLTAATLVVAGAGTLSSCGTSISPEAVAAGNQRAALLSTQISDLGLHLKGDPITGYDTDGARRVVRFAELGRLLCYVDDEHAYSTIVDPANPPTLLCAPYEKKTHEVPDAIVVLRTKTVRVPTAKFRPIGELAAALPAT